MNKTKNELLQSCIEQFEHIDLTNENKTLATTKSLVMEIKKALYIPVVSISLLKKYIQHVENCEGVNFVSDIGSPWSGIEFSKEEKALLEKLDKEIEESNEC